MYLSSTSIKADICADPIPSFRFWSGRKNRYHSCKIETGFLCGDDALVILFFARVIQQLVFWTQKIQANVDYCYVRRRAECTSFGPGLEHPTLRSDSSLAARRRAEPLHAVFFSTKHPSAAPELQLLCVYSRMIRTTKDACWVHCSPCSLGPSPRRPTASCSLAAVRRGDCVRASWLYSWSNASIATRTLLVLVLLCVPRTAAVPAPLS